MSFNYFIPYIIPLIAIGLSLSSFYYIYRQNKRKIEVDISIGYTDHYEVKLCAFNSGYRSVALVKSKFCINNKSHNIKEGWHGDTVHKQVWIAQEKKIEFPYGLKEGHVVCYTFWACQIAAYLSYLGYSGEVELSGYFKTAQKVIVESETSILFDIDKYIKVDLDYQPNVH
jgi:hypothetical protein